MGNCISSEDELKKCVKELGKTDTFKWQICDGKIPRPNDTQCCQLLDKNIIESKPIDEYENEEFEISEKNEQVKIKDIEDNRKQVNHQAYPYKSVGLIIGKIGEKFFHGSAALISGKIVLTCAHNCYNRRKKIWMNDLKFAPAANGKIGKEYSIVNVFLPKQYQNLKQKNYDFYDYAVLELEEDISEDFGTLGIDTSSNNITQNEEDIEVIGYPADKLDGEDKTMWTGDGKCVQKNENLIYYQIPTAKGQSGGPILKRVNQKYYIIGIHTAGDATKNRNCGVRLNEQKRKQINDWVGQINGSLDLHDRNLGKQIRSLVDRKFNLKIIYLDINKNNITEKDLKHLARKEWESIKILKISNNPFGDKGVEYLNAFPNVTHLQMWNCSLTQQGIQGLPQLQNLSYLCISHNQIGNEGFLKLSKYRKLKKLLASMCNIDKQGLMKLDENCFPKVEVLALKWNKIYDDGVQYLDNFKNLKSLWIEEIGMTEKGLENLSNLKIAPRLKKLHIGENKIGNQIGKLSQFTNLQEVNIYNINIQILGLTRLEKICKERSKPLKFYVNPDEIEKSGKKFLQEGNLHYELEDQWQK